MTTNAMFSTGKKNLFTERTETCKITKEKRNVSRVSNFKKIFSLHRILRIMRLVFLILKSR